MWPRALLEDERNILGILLSKDFDGVEELRRQAQAVTASGLSCTCGCPSLRLQVDRSVRAARTSGMVVDGVGVDMNGNIVGVLLFVTEDGYLDELDIYAFGGDIHGGITDNHGKPTIESFELAKWQMDPDGKSGTLTNTPPVIRG